MAFDLCKEYDLLSPIYSYAKRGGCWFCPSATLREWAHTKEHYPELWGELMRLSKTENLISQVFSYNKTFSEVDALVDAYIERKCNEQLQLRLEV